MRLSRLDLTRFGIFTGHSLEFGRTNSGPDLHIIYGPNEAGKSTLRLAINDFLFGIERTRKYPEFHDQRALEIGGFLEIQGQDVEWRRVKKDKASLLSQDGRPANQAMLDAALGGMDRDTFELMFSLDSETLKKGGEELHRSRGRLGEALFAATSGLSSISAKLEEVRSEAENVFKPRGRKHRLKQLRDALDSVDAQLKAVTVSAPQYRQLIEAFKEASRAYETARRDAGSVKTRLEQIKRWQGAMRDWSKLRIARDDLAPLVDTPDIDERTAARIHDLDEQASQLRRDIEQAERDRARLCEERDALAPDEALLAEAERIERLTRLEDRFHQAQDNLPAAEADLATARGRIGATLEKLGVDPAGDPRALLLPAPLAGQLDDMIRAHDGVMTALQTAKDEADRVRDALAELEEGLKALGEPVDPAGLHQLRVAARDARAAQDTADLEDAVASAETKRDDAFVALAPWSGSPDELAAMTPPDSAQVKGWAEERATWKDKRDQAERRREEQAARADEFRNKIAALEEATGLVSDEDLERKRAARDTAWRTHRDSIGAGDLGRIAETADAFEAAMTADDNARARRERHGDEAARLRQLTIDAAEAEAAANRAQTERENSDEALNALQLRIDAAAAALGLPTGWPPERIEGWLDARDKALAAQDELTSLQAKLERQREHRGALHEQLTSALISVGAAPAEATDLPALIDFAETVAQKADAREVRREQKREEFARARAQSEARQRRLSEAKQAEADWAARWHDLLGQCWLGTDEIERQPAQVGDILRLLDDLRSAVERAETLERDIARSRETKADFLALCRAVCATTGMPLDETDPARALTALRLGLDAAREQRAKREQTEQEIARLRESLVSTRQQLETVESELGGLSDQFGAADAKALRATIERAREKARIRRGIAELEESLRAAFDGRALDAIEQELAACDSDALSVEAQTLGEEIEARDEAVQRLYHDMKKAEEAVEAVGADEKAAALGERRHVLLLQIEDEARRYLCLMAGVAAAETAIRAYRDKHRSAMMLNAARCFRHITGGRFTDLVSQPADAGEILIAIQSGGGSKKVDELSDGTRDQLFLALRMAGYQEFAATREPLPLIADDIMQSFDDDRARATFTTLADVARIGQVIYLTHHTHLCELARDMVGNGVKVHELPAPTPAPQPAATSEPT